jgi:two-component system LytT family response regulator
MLRCIIVDDESGAVEILTRYVLKTDGLDLVGSFRDSIEALNFLVDNDVDLVFLDIDMPNLDGIRLSSMVRGKKTQVVFCTAYSEYAIESYEKEALDYLLKPIAYERFRQAAEKAMKAYSQLIAKPQQLPGSERNGQTNKLFIKSGPRIHQVDIRELLFMEKKEHYVVFHTPEGQLLSRMNMSDLLSVLPTDDFIRIHRSYVIAIDKIDIIEKHWIVIKGRKIPIGESYRDDFFKRIRYSGK